MALTLTQQQIDDLITTANAIVDSVYASEPETYFVKQIVVTHPGGGYTTSVPSVTLSSPGVTGGVTATAVASLSPLTTSNDRYITSITITNPGSKYTSAPSVSISGGGGSATAVAVLEKTADATLRTNLVQTVLAQLISEAIDRSTAQLTLIEGHQENISTQETTMATQQTTMATQQTTMATQQTTMATQQTTMATQQTTIAGHQGTIADKTTILANETITIDNHLDRIQTVVRDIDWDNPQYYERDGTYFRMIGASPISNEGDIARAMMMLNLKTTGNLDALKQELKNPTSLK